MKTKYYVMCNKCDEKMHNVSDVKLTNIEEDIFGNDVETFICPNSNEETKSRVYKMQEW